MLIASALSAAFVSPTVLAQASNFAGFYGQVGIGYEYNTVKSSGPNYFTNGTTVSSSYWSPNSASSNNFSSSLGAGFGLAITDRVLLSIGLEYQPMSSDTGLFSIDFGGGDSSGTINRNYYEIKNRYGIFLSPGYAIDDAKLAYMKIGYTSQEVNVNPSISDSARRLAKSGQSVDGYLIGLGYRQLINKNIYFFAEANYREYGSAEFTVRSSNVNSDFYVNNKQKSSNFNALVGVGARF